MISKFLRLILIGMFMVMFAGCADMHYKREHVGMVTGAVVGGVAGSALTHGHPAGAIGGAVVGGFIGHEIGASMDRERYHHCRFHRHGRYGHRHC